MSIYDHQVKNINGKDVSLSDYKGKVLLVVNTASECGLTPQYEGLEELYKKYKDNLEILAFPCNQFGGQEPGDEEKIKEFCNLRFNISFPLFAKIEVNGENTHPLYNYLKQEAPGLMGTKKIKWNFTKFLIDKEGNVIKRFAPTSTPESLEDDIKKLF
jgi:glutathione peroxidase